MDMPIESDDKIKEAFAVFDTANSGFLDRVQFKEMLVSKTEGGCALSEGEVDTLFESVDADNSGNISITEFIAWSKRGNTITAKKEQAGSHNDDEGVLDPGGWEYPRYRGEIKDGQPKCQYDEENCMFTHSQALAPGDIYRMKVESGTADGVGLAVGFAGPTLDAEKERQLLAGTVSFGNCKHRNTAEVRLPGLETRPRKPGLSTAEDGMMMGEQVSGCTLIEAEMSLDGERHRHSALHPFQSLDREHKVASIDMPREVALRIDTDGLVPQVQFNEDGVWYDFAPRPDGEARAALKEGPWFPYLNLHHCSNRLSDIRVDHPRPTKGAGMVRAAGEGADAAEGAGSAEGGER
jgi:hypothetical protein